MESKPVFTHTEDELLPILEELRRREPIFHSSEFGTSTADYEQCTATDYWEVGASGRRYSRDFILRNLYDKPPTFANSLGWESWDHALRRLGPDNGSLIPFRYRPLEISVTVLECIMKRIVLILFFVITVTAKAQSSMQGQNSAKETLARGYWIDPSTGLMWTAKDNGNDISWGNAVKYCQNLRLAGYSDWRLPSIDELQSIYDGSGFTAPHSKGSMLALAGRAKGWLLLTGAREWSVSRVLDDRGHRTGIAWQYDFPHGERWRFDPIGYTGSLRALCVRHP